MFFKAGWNNKKVLQTLRTVIGSDRPTAELLLHSSSFGRFFGVSDPKLFISCFIMKQMKPKHLRPWAYNLIFLTYCRPTRYGLKPLSPPFNRWGSSTSTLLPLSLSLYLSLPTVLPISLLATFPTTQQHTCVKHWRLVIQLSYFFLLFSIPSFNRQTWHQERTTTERKRIVRTGFKPHRLRLPPKPNFLSY